MSKDLRRHAPVVFVTALLLGASTPALADVESGTPKEDIPSEANDDGNSGDKGGCSVQDPRLGLAGLAGLVFLVSGASLRRRRA